MSKTKTATRYVLRSMASVAVGMIGWSVLSILVGQTLYWSTWLMYLLRLPPPPWIGLFMG